MTKKRNLTTFMIAIMIMLFSLPANAQGTVGYAQYNVDSKTLTFKGGESVPSGAFALNTEGNAPGWSGKSSCTKVVFDDSFKDVRPTSCYKWFSGFWQLTTIQGIENLNTENVTDMREMFNNCKSLTSLDLSSFNTAKVESMSYMFRGCSGLTSLDVSKFNTAKVTHMGDMFRWCSSLTSLDLSPFNTAKVTNMDFMFDGCSGLTTIYVSDNFSIGNVTYDSDMFSGCRQLKGAAPYASNKTDKNMANFDGYFTPKNITPYVKWDASTNVLTFKVANNKEEGAYDLNEGENDPGWLGAVSPECTKVVFTSSFNHAKPTSCYKWFKDFGQLTTIQGIENLNTEEVKNMRYMFSGCSGLTSLNLSNFNTANVTTMSNMFDGCSGLESLDLSSFNTAKVTTMGSMFNKCSRLESLDLSSFNTANVEDMSNMFYGCSGLTTIYVSDDFTTGTGTNGSNMFSGCTSLNGKASYSKDNTGIDMANYKTGYFTKSNLTPYVKWNADTKVLTFKVANYIEGTEGEWKLNDGTKVPGWYNKVNNNCTKVVFTPPFKQAKPTSCYQWFYGFWPLTTIEGIENLNTEEVTNMYRMFGDCSGLTSLDLSSFNTAAVTNMEYMFYNCSGLTSLDLSSFNTAEVTHMFYMFGGCSGLKTIYVSDAFTTNKVGFGSGIFTSCVGLKGATSYNSDKTGIDMANYKDGYFKTYFTLGENKVELCGNPLTTKSLNLTGDYDFTPKYEFKANEATYYRDLSTSGSTWFSLCLPFAYTPDNFTAYQLKGASANAVEIGEISGEIAAGTPVLFKFKDGVVDKTINLSATDAQIVKAPVEGAKVTGDDGSSLQLCGTYQTKTFSKDADGNAFILLKDKLMNPAKMMLENQNVTTVGVKPFRAYMTLTASAQTSSARAFSIGRGDEGNEGTTAIDLLNSVATDDAEYYDINGRRIDAPAKGVNIVRRGNKTMKLIIK